MEPGTSHWDVSFTKKSRFNKNKDNKSLDSTTESSIHKYPLRNRLSTSFDNSSHQEDLVQVQNNNSNNKAGANNRKKHKVNSDLLTLGASVSRQREAETVPSTSVSGASGPRLTRSGAVVLRRTRKNSKCKYFDIFFNYCLFLTL